MEERKKIMEIRRLLDFLKTAEQLKCNTRHSYTSSGRLESVAEHSWRLALMAMLVGDEFPEMDMDKVIKMCLIHDMGEAITGDIPAFEKTDKDRKVENKKVEQLTDILPEPVRAEWKALFEEMEAMETQEARLYKSLDKLEALCYHVKANSLCGLGQTAPNPVLSTLRYFRDEYIAHIVEKRCPAGVCKDLLSYEIQADKCKGCTACARVCPAGAISGSVKNPHTIDKSKCLKCGACIEKCRFGAIIKK